jgi:hypothetical protein
MNRLVPWFPLAAALAHISEEFVLPGGFGAWYRRYRSHVARITPRFLVLVNGGLILACLNVALIGVNPVGAGYWLLIAGIMASNGLWHAWATCKSRCYSPGVVTGVLVYVPMAVYGFLAWVRSGTLPIAPALLLTGIGTSYHLWSYLYHRPVRA